MVNPEPAGGRFGGRVARMREVPAGRMVELPGRGRTYLVDIPGPGGAPTVILLHGLVTTAMLNWFPALAELSERYRVVLYDQRWHGRGIRSPRWELDDLADDVVAVADLLGVERPILAGYSMGGIVAQLAAHRHPRRFGGLVLCATTYRFRETLRERAFHRAMGTVMGGLSRTASRRVTAAARRLPALPQITWENGRMDRWALAELRSTSGWAVAQAIAELGRFDSSDWLPELSIPAAVVITTHDRALPVYRQLEMAKLVAGAEIFLAKAGHAACAFEADTFVPVLLDACAAVAARR
ncbi:pimeloyl-ACP methyl ester carboxylesterase [Nocardia transvalensis]|uniref:Pimeloyl-ACP methyl ester carboxylesterase n=1 Tax=Nocardia transvalensis TaxID=37333 RepID=A0A7W9UL74_9NOCA|nr:alpha/beta hydrolase [Nocardia transvalensis]MBB5917254.1 pimeloyl-ACP methyl ester carboxylesterase [Nocardia transvalensis]